LALLILSLQLIDDQGTYYYQARISSDSTNSNVYHCCLLCLATKVEALNEAAGCLAAHLPVCLSVRMSIPYS